MTTIMQTDEVRVWFGGVKAVDGISLSIEEGRIYGLVGPNGSGKTTLINAISLVTPVTGGTISFDGQDVTKRRPYDVGRRGLARTYQGIRLIPTLSVLQNVMLGADNRVSLVQNSAERSRLPRWLRIDQHSVKEAAAAALERVGLSHTAGALPGSLSYGMQRRVEIARAIAGQPRLLLLDEPVAGMNGAERREIAALLASLRDDGITQLLVEHDLRMVLELSDHLFVANFGQLIAEGDPAATAADPDVMRAYLGHRS